MKLSGAVGVDRRLARQRVAGSAAAVLAPAYIPPPRRCERLADMVERFGGEMREVPGEIDGGTTYTIPAQAEPELQAFFKTLSPACPTRAAVARLPGGRVFGSGNVLSPDGTTIARDVSTDFGKAFEEHWLLGYRQMRAPVPVAGTVAVVATTLGAGYGHWLLEELPRLLAIPPAAETTWIAHASSSYASEALRLHGVTGRVIEPARYSHYGCEELLVPALAGEPGYPTLAGVRTLREFVAPLLEAQGATRRNCGERLYISRGRARRRRILNEAALWPRLEARGFVQVHLEALTWAEQIQAFRGAREVVAPHGAGLANLVFCEPGTRVVEIFNRAYVNPCYWRLASLRGLDYRPLAMFGPGANEPTAPLTHALTANRLDVAVDVEAVVRALA